MAQGNANVVKQVALVSLIPTASDLSLHHLSKVGELLQNLLRSRLLEDLGFKRLVALECGAWDQRAKIATLERSKLLLQQYLKELIDSLSRLRAWRKEPLSLEQPQNFHQS